MHFYAHFFAILLFNCAFCKTLFFVDFVDSGESGEKLLSSLYDKYKEAVGDAHSKSHRRMLANGEEYDVHVQKLSQVNGLKKHNLVIKKHLRNGKSDFIYIRNPLESRLPQTYLTLEGFRAALEKRADLLRNNKNNEKTNQEEKVTASETGNEKPKLEVQSTVKPTKALTGRTTEVKNATEMKTVVEKVSKNIISVVTSKLIKEANVKNTTESMKNTRETYEKHSVTEKSTNPNNKDEVKTFDNANITGQSLNGKTDSMTTRERFTTESVTESVTSPSAKTKTDDDKSKNIKITTESEFQKPSTKDSISEHKNIEDTTELEYQMPSSKDSTEQTHSVFITKEIIEKNTNVEKPQSTTVTETILTPKETTQTEPVSEKANISSENATVKTLDKLKKKRKKKTTKITTAVAQPKRKPKTTTDSYESYSEETTTKMTRRTYGRPMVFMGGY